MFQNGDIMSVQLIFVFVNARVSSHQNHLSLKLSLGRQRLNVKNNIKIPKRCMNTVEFQAANQHQQLLHVVGLRSGGDLWSERVFHCRTKMRKSL